MAVAGGNPTRFAALVALRLRGHPLQYLEGTAAFGPLDLAVDERVLIPRPETEQLWEMACRLVPHPRVVVDLGTGSGALALAFAHRLPAARVVAVDASPEALEVASANGDRLVRRTATASAKMQMRSSVICTKRRTAVTTPSVPSSCPSASNI